MKIRISSQKRDREEFQYELEYPRQPIRLVRRHAISSSLHKKLAEVKARKERKIGRMMDKKIKEVASMLSTEIQSSKI